jgi:hypothetical protein
MTKKSNVKKYVPIGMKKNCIISVMGPEMTEDNIHEETKRVLLDNSRFMQELIYDNTDKGIKTDFVQMSGTIAYYCEKETAKNIMKLEKEYIDLISKNPKKRIKLREEFFEKFRELAEGSFIPYAYVNFYEMIDDEGSFYNGCESLNPYYQKGEQYAEGIISIPKYLEKIKDFGWMEGVIPQDPSIENPIDFIEYCIEDNKGNTFFGYATPFTVKAKSGIKEYNKKMGK